MTQLKSITFLSSCLIFLGLILFSCFPLRNFEKAKHPSGAPEYSKEEFWIALPWRHDIGDTIPPGCTIKEDQQDAQVDVFYIHPTVYLIGGNWNADLSNEGVNARADACVQFQASAFNACARVFAPRYRQAHIKAFFDTENKEAALDFAYADVKAAFEYYLANWNKGRPIIIAGHSQGARHAVKLLKEFFDGTELQNRLVAAYPIGMPISKTEFKHLPLADSATQTNCFVTWNTFLWGADMNEKGNFYKGGLCVNPISWKTDDTYASASENKGSVSFKYNGIDKGVTGAKVNEGILWIHEPEFEGYPHLGKSYHLCDFNLFYMNIRQNAIDRTEAYLRKNN